MKTREFLSSILILILILLGLLLFPVALILNFIFDTAKIFIDRISPDENDESNNTTGN